MEVATGLVSMLLANPGFYGIVAEENGQIVGSNFAGHRSSIAGIGPISVDPASQRAHPRCAERLPKENAGPRWGEPGSYQMRESNTSSIAPGQGQPQ
jgi:hypothetical protein